MVTWWKNKFLPVALSAETWYSTTDSCLWPVIDISSDLVKISLTGFLNLFAATYRNKINHKSERNNADLNFYYNEAKPVKVDLKKKL